LTSQSISRAISFRAVIARPLIDSMTHPKFLTNFVWKQNGNILAKIRLRKREPPSKLLKKLEPPAGVEPATY
jgi:hypothetical protein